MWLSPGYNLDLSDSKPFSFHHFILSPLAKGCSLFLRRNPHVLSQGPTVGDCITVPDYSPPYPCDRIIRPCSKSHARDLGWVTWLALTNETSAGYPSSRFKHHHLVPPLLFPCATAQHDPERGCSYSLDPLMKTTWEGSCSQTEKWAFVVVITEVWREGLFVTTV